MRLIHRVADKPIQFPRGHRRPTGEINRCGTPEGQPGAALFRRQGRLLRSVPTNEICHLAERKGYLSPREGNDTLDTVVAANCSAPPRGLATINYPDERPIKCDKSSASPGAKTRGLPPSNVLDTNGKSDYAAASVRGETDSPSF